MWFEVVSGLKVNLSKSEIILVGRVENMEGFAIKLGCRIGSLPTTYLGLPLGAPHNLWGFGIQLRNGFVKGCPLGRGSIFPRVGELL